LGRDAADVEAGAAERLVLLDHHHLHAELRRADRAEIAARAGTDDDEVITGHHVYSLVVVPAECHSASKTRVNALMAREPGSILRVLARARSISARLRGTTATQNARLKSWSVVPENVALTSKTRDDSRCPYFHK